MLRFLIPPLGNNGEALGPLTFRWKYLPHQEAGHANLVPPRQHLQSGCHPT